MKKLIKVFDDAYTKRVTFKGVNAALAARLRRFVARNDAYAQTEHLGQRLRMDLGTRWQAMELGTIWWLPPRNR